MGEWNMKRVSMVAIAVCILGTTTAVAAGEVVYISGGGSHLDGFTYDKLRGIETELGCTIGAPETFSNGHGFDMGMPIHQDAMGQDGDVIESTGDFSLSCEKDGSPNVFITTQGTSLYSEERQPDQTFDRNGITLNYTRDQYRFVPPGYQVSDEEKAKGTAEEPYISYGNDRVQDKVTQSMLQKDGEEVYIITAMDSPITTRDMTQMAGELIDNKQ